MTTYFVSRHDEAVLWTQIMSRLGKLPFVIDRYIADLDPAMLRRGDVVIGTLPLHLIAQLDERGIAFRALDLNIPAEWRGQELTPTQMAKCGARLTRYQVKRLEHTELRPANAAPQSGRSCTLIPVSQELAPAAIGLRMCPTEEVLLLASPRMRQTAAASLRRWIEQVARTTKVKLRDWADADFVQLSQQAREILQTLAAENRSRIALNLTGGTKLMTSALLGALQELPDALRRRFEPYYVDTEHRRLERLDAPETARPLNACLRIRDLLALKDYEIRGSSQTPNSRALRFARFLLEQEDLSWLPEWNELFALINDAVSLKSDKRLNWSQKFLIERQRRGADGFTATLTPKTDRDVLRRLQRVFSQDALKKMFEWALLRVSFSEDAARLELKCGDAKALSNLSQTFSGGWWEEHLFEIARGCGVLEALQGVHIAPYTAQRSPGGQGQSRKGQRSPNENELDLLAVSGNQLLMVEAKAANLAAQYGQDTKGTQALYKIFTVTEQLARLFGARWLVSLRPVNASDVERAGQLGIRVIHPPSDTLDRAAIEAVSTEFRSALEAWVAQTHLEPLPGVQWSAPPAPADRIKPAVRGSPPGASPARSGRERPGARGMENRNPAPDRAER